jgi:hypothetical protein
MRHFFRGAGMLWLGAALVNLPVWAGTGGLALVPGRLEIEAKPGVEKTVTFQIESPPSDEPVSGRLILSLTDWNLSQEGAMEFQEPGAGVSMSAAPWLTFSPAAVSIQSGQKYLVRVTVLPPKDIKPGVYRAGIFVQERPPASVAKKGDHNIYFRFRYMEVLYVIIPPVAANPKLVETSLHQSASGLEILCTMANEGSGFVRPRISWALKDASGAVVRQEKSRDSTVLLPSATLSEHIPLPGIGPGRYELAVQADFGGELPIQAMTRSVEITP